MTRAPLPLEITTLLKAHTDETSLTTLFYELGMGYLPSPEKAATEAG